MGGLGEQVKGLIGLVSGGWRCSHHSNYAMRAMRLLGFNEVSCVMVDRGVAWLDVRRRDVTCKDQAGIYPGG